MSIAQKLIGQSRMSVDPVAKLAAQVAQISASSANSNPNIGAMMISMESHDAHAQQLASVSNNIEAQLTAIGKASDFALEAYQIEAGTIGGMMATNPRQVGAAQPRPLPQNSTVLNMGLADAMPGRSIALEAYDDREIRVAQTHSILYNMLSSRQDAFGEAFFPTIICSPNEVGATIAMRLFYVYNDFKRSATGALANYNRKNMVRAYADTSLLKNELTRGVPVLRQSGSDANTDRFVALTDVPAWTENLGVGVNVETAALKVDTKVDLLGLSQTNELLASGVMGPTDNLDSFIKLARVFVKVTDGTDTDVFALNVSTLPASSFTHSVQGNSRRMQLLMDTDSVVLSPATKKLNGNALDVLDELANHTARVQLSIAGSVTLDNAQGSVQRGQLSLVALRNATNDLVTGAAFASLAGKLANAEIIGYTLQFFRANSNLRQRGQLVDTQTEYRVIPVNWRSPLSALVPVAREGVDDASTIESLITATGVRVSNEAIIAMHRVADELKAYVPMADASGTLPEMNAIGHYLVKPVYFEENIDLAQTVDSRASHERLADIRAALVEKIRYYANEMLRTSEYQAAAAVLTGNKEFKPTVLVGTDPVLANYLQSDGDLRTLGDNFDVKVVSSLAFENTGKIFISFGVFDSNRNSQINPLNFGNMLYTPEMVLNMPIAVDGQTSKQMTVTPRFVHFCNLPVLTKLNVSGLPTVTGKVTVNFHTV